jgi:histidinol phosphatase-like enzyme
MALENLFPGILALKHSLRKLVIGSNKGLSNGKTMQLLQQIISESSSLKHLNMSNMHLDAKECKQFSDYLIQQFGKQWNLNSSIREIVWDEDYKSDVKAAKKFMAEQIP